MQNKEQYPAGTILRLTEPIEDPYSPKPVGARLCISHIDDAGQMHGEWLPPESGSIAIIPEKDAFIVEEYPATQRIRETAKVLQTFDNWAMAGHRIETSAGVQDTAAGYQIAEIRFAGNSVCSIGFFLLDRLKREKDVSTRNMDYAEVRYDRETGRFPRKNERKQGREQNK